jgi:hypothetical protein
MFGNCYVCTSFVYFHAGIVLTDIFPQLDGLWYKFHMNMRLQDSGLEFMPLRDQGMMQGPLFSSNVRTAKFSEFNTHAFECVRVYQD